MASSNVSGIALHEPPLRPRAGRMGTVTVAATSSPWPVLSQLSRFWVGLCKRVKGPPSGYGKRGGGWQR